MSRFKKPLSGLSRLSDRESIATRYIGPRIRSMHGQASGSSLTIPPGVKAGDIILLASIGNPLPGLPTGFTNLVAVTGYGLPIRCSYKISDGTETTISVSNATVSSILLIENHDGIGGFSSSNSTGQGVKLPVITATKNNSRVFSFWNLNSSVDPIDNMRGVLISRFTGMSMDVLEEGDAFGGVVYSGVSSARGTISVEVLAA